MGISIYRVAEVVASLDILYTRNSSNAPNLWLSVVAVGTYMLTPYLILPSEEIGFRCLSEYRYKTLCRIERSLGVSGVLDLVPVGLVLIFRIG